MTSTELTDIEPLHHQAVSRVVFDNCMKEFFDMLQPTCTATQNLLADDENALRYASGYVGMKLLREFRTDRSSKVSQYRECLSKMSKDDDDSSFCAYTKAWNAAWPGGNLCGP